MLTVPGETGAPDALPTGAVAFTARGVSKSYPGVRALDEVSLEGYAGEVLAICGANGAGKSTFARLLAGQETPSTGEILVTGHDRAITSPAEAERAGVLLMHQEPLVIDDFTVGENVWLYGLRSGKDIRPWRRSRRSDDERTRAALRHVGLGHISPRTQARDLGPGQRQMLALSRAGVTPHKVMILDETTASTTEEHFRDVEEMVQAEKDTGTSVIFVSHRLPEVFALADRIAVLRNGKLVDVLRTADTDAEEITTLMIGEALRATERPAPPALQPSRPPVLAARGITAGAAKNISFDVHPGEVVGLYGLVGSGRSSVARAISGQQRPHSGTLELGGRPVRFRSPGAALRHKVAYMTEDRRREGFVASFTNAENLSLVALPKLGRAGVIDAAREKAMVDELIDRYQVKGGPQTLTRTLSGGNQQKICIAKWLVTDPELVVLDEPTKGIDVGARANIYEIVQAAAAQGIGVVVVTSEAEEALQLCHRVLVLRDGELVAELDPEHSSTEDLIRAALGGIDAKP